MDKRFYIVPKEQEITINGKNKEDAIANFATGMDLDMNTYFKVLTEEEYKEYKEQAEYKFSGVDFGEATDIDGEIVTVEDADGNYLYEKGD